MARAGSGIGSGRPVTFQWARKILGTTWKLITQTVGTCLRYRVTGLAAEAAFFAILSLPPLIFGLAGSIGFIASRYFDVETIDEVKLQIAELAGRALTAESVTSVILPTLDQVLDGGRPDVISIGFVLALWSGSRALNVFVDTITIMYGMGGKRGIIRTRALSFSLYCVALVIGVIVLPLVLAGPGEIADLLPPRLDFLNQLYWPVVTVLSAGFLNTLYHLSVPVRTPWVSDLPGSFLALSIWIVGSFVLRWVLQTTVGGTSIYGPLAAPIAVLLWLYLTAIAVLIGAALNSVVDQMWPHKVRQSRKEQEAAEPAMKAEAGPPTSAEEREEALPDGARERPETKVARTIEALGQTRPANLPDSGRDRAPDTERQGPAERATDIERQGPTDPAPDSERRGPAARATATEHLGPAERVTGAGRGTRAGRETASDRRPGAEREAVSEREGRPGRETVSEAETRDRPQPRTGSGTGQEPVAKAAGRKPASVGKPRARGVSDDLR